MKRIGAVGLAVTMMLVLGMGSALAAGGTSVESFPVSFVLSSATCSHLPDGTTITGSGTETSVTTIRTDQSGVTTIINATHAFGTAADQNGNGYAFNYSNEFRVSNSVADPDALTGLMTDSFSLAGSGPARLTNGFVANITLAPTFEAQPISAHGDPISFPDGTAHCDPL
jgi:hypothetical protein